jgi:hypothetical protein
MRGLYLPPRPADTDHVERGTPQQAPRTTRFRRSRGIVTPEELNAHISQLVAERQELRARGAEAAALERNRLRIAQAQWELAHALIDQHRPAVAQSAA